MNLIAGHDGIEFGWLLCKFIPYLRYISNRYDKVTIVCNPENRYLFEDFADKYIDYRKPNTGDMWFAKRFPNEKVKIPDKIKKEYSDCFVIEPNEENCTSDETAYIPYGKKIDDISCDVVFHARATNKYGQAKINYDPKLYEEILSEMRKTRPIRACSIGTSAYYIKGTDDKRNMPMIHLCYTLANAKVCVGTSSGPMHLASLCKCPHVVISNNKKLKSINATNKKRYEKLWNPFKTPCTIIDEHNWHPPKELVKEAIGKYL